MQRKVITALTVVMALCLAFTVFALNKTNVSPKQTAGADCCAKKDSCPMKKGDNTDADKHSCCEKQDCCSKGDNCPMKMDGEKSEGTDCCSKSDSCPMKKSEEKKTTASVDMTNVTVVSDSDGCCQPGADCCKGGSCCKGKHS